MRPEPKTPNVDPEERFLTRVCWAYHVEGLTQSAVAAKLGTTRLRVNRALAEARRIGLVRIAFNTAYSACADLEHGLAERFGLTTAYVAPAPAEAGGVQTIVGAALGNLLGEVLTDSAVRLFGMSWGNTLNLATRFMAPLDRPDLEIVSVMGGLTRGSDLNSFEITTRLADLANASHSYFTAPLYAGSRESRDTILQLDVFAEVLAKIRSVDALAMAAGDISARSLLMRDALPKGVSMDDLRRKGAVGDVLGTVIDADGQPLDHPINERVIGIGLDDLAAVPNVILAAGGPHKVPVIRAVLGRGLIDSVVTDEATARAVLGGGRMSDVIGIDIGTSGVKAVVVHDDGTTGAEASRPLAVSMPHPGWSEQSPDLWVEAVFGCLDDLAARTDLSGVAGLGLSGQMLGLVLLDRGLRPLRPAMLWNDQRALAECADLARRVPDIGRRTNCAPDPGLNAPKLLWMARHEPDLLAQGAMLLLPKDYVRLALTGVLATEPTDAGGTQLFDVGTGDWADDLCAAAGWRRAALPEVVETWAAAGTVLPDLARRWGFAGPVPVAAGAGDNMAATLGTGAGRPGDGVVTIGTSAVACLVDGRFHPAPDKAVLTSAHAAPDCFLSMGVVMSATASLDWVARLTGRGAADLAAAAEAVLAAGRAPDAPLFLPALNGIRTPLGRPDMTGRLHGLRPGTDADLLAWATLEGVALQIADCVEAQLSAGVPLERLAVVGGGTRSRLWVRMVASLLDRPAGLPPAAAVSACLGAARLARVAAGLDPVAALGAGMPDFAETVAPDPALADLLATRREGFRQLYP